MCAGGGVSARNAYSRVLGEFFYEISYNSTLLFINQTQTFDHLHIDKPQKPIERLNAANMQQITEPHQIFFHISNIYSPKPLKLSPSRHNYWRSWGIACFVYAFVVIIHNLLENGYKMRAVWNYIFIFILVLFLILHALWNQR